MKKFFKRIIKFIILFCVIVAGLTFLNNETDILSDLSRYIPESEFTEIVEKFSEDLAQYTGDWPTLQQMYATAEKSIRGKEDIAVNEYIKDSPMLSFYPDETIGVKTDNESVTLYGRVCDEDKQNFIAVFTDSSDNKLSQTSFAADLDREFSKKIPFPQTDSERIALTVYYCPKAYGEYRSWVMEYLYFVKNENGVFTLETSDVYESNTGFYETEKSLKNSLRAWGDVVSDNDDLIEFTSQIVSDCNTDYEKILAIHDWICENIYYDEDSLTRGEYPPYKPIDVLNSRRGVCKGFAYLFASMARSQKIPTTIVSGYALGIDGKYDWESVSNTKTQNHAWNEAYVDGRWVIVDTTWDCGNSIENSEIIKEGTSHLFFDANLKYFSANHKIMQYFYK